MKLTSILLLSFALGIALVLAAGCGSGLGEREPLIERPTRPTEERPSEASGGEAEAQETGSVSAWQQDLSYLASRMPEVHPNLYWRVSEAEFREAVQELHNQIPALNEQEVIVELARLASLIDGHTHLPLFQANVGFQLYPLRLYLFDDGLFVVDADDENADIIGAQVTAIADTDIETALEAVAPLVPHDNEMSVQLLAPVYLTIPEVLQALGIITDTEMPGFVLEHANGRTDIVHLRPRSSEAYRDWTSLFVDLAGLPALSEPVGLARRDERFWYSVLHDSNTLYIQYNQVQASTETGVLLTTMVEQIESDLANNDFNQIVVDIRHNPGGNVRTSEPLLDLLSINQSINFPERLFVIIGRNTFSAATLFAVDLERKSSAIFVGEPTGGRPNLYADVRPITLPNSQISVMVSTIYWQRSHPEDGRDWIEPDISISLSSSDYFRGSDPAMDEILGYTTAPDT